VVSGKRESFYEVKDKPGSWLASVRKRRSRPRASSAVQVRPARFEAAASRVANCCTVLAIFVQGLLGGMALMTLLQVYLVNVASWGDDAVLMLRSYAPVALKMNRLYWVFLVIALGAAASRCVVGAWRRQCRSQPLTRHPCRAAWSTLVFAPQSVEEYLPEGMLDVLKALRFRLVDYAMVSLYALAFLLNILSASVDDELDYAISRDPGFYNAPMSRGFLNRIQSWHALNAFKCAAVLLAWFLVRFSPGLGYECVHRCLLCLTWPRAQVIWEWQPRALGRILETVAELEQTRLTRAVSRGPPSPLRSPQMRSPCAVSPLRSPLVSPSKYQTSSYINASYEPLHGMVVQPSVMTAIR